MKTQLNGYAGRCRCLEHFGHIVSFPRSSELLVDDIAMARPRTTASSKRPRQPARASKQPQTAASKKQRTAAKTPPRKAGVAHAERKRVALSPASAANAALDRAWMERASYLMSPSEDQLVDDAVRCAGGLAVWRFGGLAVWRSGGLVDRRSGGPAVWWFGGLVVWLKP